MKVKELIAILKNLDPDLPVRVGIGCSCYGDQEAESVEVVAAEPATVGMDRVKKHVFIE